MDHQRQISAPVTTSTIEATPSRSCATLATIASLVTLYSMAGMGVATAQPAKEIKFGLYYVDTEYGGNGKPGWVRVGDIDGDEDQDVVAGGGGALFIYENDGDPDPGTWTRWGAGNDGLAQGNSIGANGAVLFDVNEDGALDVVSAKAFSTFGWWENPDTPLSDTVWQFHTIASVPPNYFMHDVIATDIDGDGVAEEFVKNLNHGYWSSDIVVSWHKRLSGGGWESHDIEPFRNEGTPHGHAGLDAADIDGDLDVDIAYANGWYENSGDATGTWVWHEISDVYGISNTLIREMSGDTRPDIVMSGGHHGQGVYWYEQPLTSPGSSSWTRHDISVVDGNVKARWFYDANSPALHHPESLGVLDLDNDGDLDVTTADIFFGEDPAEPAWSDEVANIYVYANDGDSLSFTRTTVISEAYAGHLMQDNDLNADGKIDFVSESAGFGAVSYYENMTVPEPSETPTATPTPAPASLTKAQQACANEMNKNGEKVNKAQLKENERCLMDFQNEKLVASMTFDACMTADRKGRVLKAKVKTATQEAKRCDPLEVAPPFANTDSATVNAAAADGALALTRKIFGRSPVLDADLATKAANKDMAKCQLEMLKRADKLVNSVLKEVIKAEKKALKDETVNSGAALESKLQAVLSWNDRINKTQAALVKGVDKKCAVLQAAPDTIFPGTCGEESPNLNEVEACVIATARCEACLNINAFNDLDLDCDQADDRTSNGSCDSSMATPTATPITTPTATATPTATPSGQGAIYWYKPSGPYLSGVTRYCGGVKCGEWRYSHIAAHASGNIRITGTLKQGTTLKDSASETFYVEQGKNYRYKVLLGYEGGYVYGVDQFLELTSPHASNSRTLVFKDYDTFGSVGEISLSEYDGE